MRGMAVCNTLALLAALLLCGSPARGQAAREEKAQSTPAEKAKPEKPAKQGAANLLAEALKNNPDIRVAEAKLQEAAAELERIRLQVTQKVVTFQHALASHKQQVAVAEATLQRFLKLADRGAISADVVETAKANLILAKSKLAALEAELPYLLGKRAANQDDRAADLARSQYALALRQAQAQWQAGQARANEVAAQHALRWLARFQAARQPLGGSGAEKLRKALDTQVTLKFENALLTDAFDFLEEKASGISFRIVSSGERKIGDLPINLRLKHPVSVGAAIQAIQDTVPNLCFAVREYGVLVTWKEQLPPDAVLLLDFWKAGKDSAKPVQPAAR